jgi:hypothetical protein
LMNHSGIAMPLHVNLALQGTDRVVREVQTALRRGVQERVVATHTADRLLRSQLSSEVTGILLNSELALRQVSIPAAVADKVRSVRELAEKMRSRLQVV